MAKIERPFYPIIYVRGYAMTQDEIVQTTSTPFMGFEAGSTKIRQAHDGRILKFVFESQLVRLMKDYGYVDNYSGGAERKDNKMSPRTIAIHRYYDPADPAFGNGKTPSIPDAAAYTDLEAILAWLDGLQDLRKARQEATSPNFTQFNELNQQLEVVTRSQVDEHVAGMRAAIAELRKEIWWVSGFVAGLSLLLVLLFTYLIIHPVRQIESRILSLGAGVEPDTRPVACIDELLTTLNAGNLALAAEIARIPEEIRGYGHVKERHLKVARPKWDSLMAQWRGALAPQPVQRAA